MEFRKATETVRRTLMDGLREGRRACHAKIGLSVAAGLLMMIAADVIRDVVRHHDPQITGDVVLGIVIVPVVFLWWWKEYSHRTPPSDSP